jgi:hypothetical protein
VTHVDRVRARSSSFIVLGKRACLSVSLVGLSGKRGLLKMLYCMNDMPNMMNPKSGATH